ncbi:DUF5753 domain-containing protein [Glycomyces paridis]|uniref:DUF5753 domain-containing protein n=1 Tax=Glycomyces paridis TaxID=2126555 RepID=A0A4V4HNM6_9ACTN|nr:DUF5753 domain-containing protein [Glycomyces paridis]THV26416.1 hypothetical protein E9998_17795 [Glycomyces paridis]
MSSVKFLNGELAKLLVEWRLKKGLKTIKDAAFFLGTSPEILSGLESGTRQYMDAPLIDGILSAYGAPQYIRDDAAAKARQIRFGDPQRWQESGPSWFNRMTQLEPRATAIDIFEDTYITGLCQTVQYARAIMETNPDLKEESIGTALEFRSHRRRIVVEKADNGARLRIIQAEHSLSVIEGTDLYAEQLERLHEDNAREGIDIFVMPTKVLHPSMEGPYMILSFDDPSTPDVVYQESVLGAQYEARIDQVDRCRGVFSATLASAVPLDEWSSKKC